MRLLCIVLLGIIQVNLRCRCAGVIGVVVPQITSSISLNERLHDNSQIRRKTDSRTQQWMRMFEGGFPPQRKIASDQELELTHYLFTKHGYNPLIRPVANNSDAVQVNLGLCMIQMINLDERRQVMKSNVWLPMVWSDYQLKWDPAQYGGLRVIRIPHNRVWKPDMVLFNNADGNYEVLWRPNVLLHYDGSILWMPPAIYESSCTIDVEYFPFDEQVCEMKFGSWAFDATKVSVGLYSSQAFADLSDYWKSGTWDLVDVPAKVVNTSSGGVEYTHVIYTIKLRRKTLFYTVNLLLPCVMISLLSICMFYLPSDAGEKVTLAISIVVALVVFLILVSKILPPTSKTVPLISRYLMFTFVFNVFSVFMAVAVVNWNYQSPRSHGMPKWTKALFLDFLPKVLFMNKIQKPQEYSNSSKDDSTPTYCIANHYLQNTSDAFIQQLPEDDSLVTSSSRSSNSICPQCQANSNTNSLFTSNSHDTLAHSYENVRSLRFSPMASELSDSDSNSAFSTSTEYRTSECVQNTLIQNRTIEILKLNASPKRIGLRLKRIRRGNSTSASSVNQLIHIEDGLNSVDLIAAIMADQRESRLVVQDWRYAASVIDRLMLAIFSVITLIVALSLLTNAPSLLSSIDPDDVINKYSVLKRK